MGDLSSQSADHGVNVNPAAAEKIEVVRGPATLLYGANAIGGLVNVINEAIPTRRVSGTSGTVTIDAGTGANEGGAAGDLLWGNDRWAFRASGSARASGDVETPDERIDNSQTRSAYASAGLSWTGEKRYVGGNYAWDDSRFGVPIVEEGQVESTPRRQAFNLRAGGTGLDGFLDGYRASFGYRHYRHDELVAGDVETAFENNTAEIDVLLNHRAVGRLKGTWGAWLFDRAFSIEGEEALSPPVDQQAVAAFAYEELKWSHVTWQLGGRVDWTGYEPEQDLPARDFTNVSGSTGLLWEPHAARGKVTLAASLAFASRYPALEELYYNGPHPGNFAYEIGNPDLESERAIGVDLSLRWRYSRLAGEVTYFRNAIDDYIFRQPTGEIEEDFPVVEYVQADSVLQGFEAHTDVTITPSLIAELAMDYVRGELSDGGEPLPRMPPFRVRAGLRYQWNALQVGGEVAAVADQDRVYEFEQPTGGYELLKLFGAYSFLAGGVTNTITARLDNATNERYYNHLSYLKDFVSEMGRNFKVVYSIRF
jgi:iron complex outermembrane receptor protein